MASLALTWATGKMPKVNAGSGRGLVINRWRHGASPKSMSGILGARGWEACGLIADGPGFPLLAKPEFADGSISHVDLLACLAKWSKRTWASRRPRPPRNDIEVAMLRLAPAAETILPDDLLAAYAPAQAPLLIEPYAVLPTVTKHTRPDLRGTDMTDCRPGASSRRRLSWNPDGAAVTGQRHAHARTHQVAGSHGRQLVGRPDGRAQGA